MILPVRDLLQLFGLRSGVDAGPAIIYGVLEGEPLAQDLVAPFWIRGLEADGVQRGLLRLVVLPVDLLHLLDDVL